MINYTSDLGPIHIWKIKNMDKNHFYFDTEKKIKENNQFLMLIEKTQRRDRLVCYQGNRKVPWGPAEFLEVQSKEKSRGFFLSNENCNMYNHLTSPDETFLLFKHKDH